MKKLHPGFQLKYTLPLKARKNQHKPFWIIWEQHKDDDTRRRRIKLKKSKHEASNFLFKKII